MVEIFTMTNLTSRLFWERTAPFLTIEGDGLPSLSSPLDPATMEKVSDVFWREGYLHLPPMFQDDVLAPIRRGIEALVVDGIHPAFIYVYDEPWRLFQGLSELIAHFLGEDFGLLPHLWAWYISERPDRSGWPPHTDCEGQTRFDEGGMDMLMSLSLWVPLTDATPENGCMYVLPRTFEMEYVPPIQDPSEIRLQDARALPAPRGSVLGWPQDLYHWSGRSSHLAKEPRISLSFEFQNRAFDPMTKGLLDLNNLPSFEERVDLVIAQFGKYTHMERPGRVMQELLDRLEAPSSERRPS